MSNREIIDRAASIVRRSLDAMDEFNEERINLSKTELLQISTALVVARIQNMEHGD